MFKLLATKGAAHAVEVMADSGLLLILLGGVTPPQALHGMIKAEDTLGLAPDPVRRLAALALSSAREDAERLALGGGYRMSRRGGWISRARRVSAARIELVRGWRRVRVSRAALPAGRSAVSRPGF